MRTNEFSIGGLVRLHVSSIAKWGYQDNLNPAYLFIFLPKIFEHTKTEIKPKPTNKTKTNEQKTTKVTSFHVHKNF